MPRTLETLTLADAKQILEAGEAKAASLGIPYNIAVATSSPSPARTALSREASNLP